MNRLVLLLVSLWAFAIIAETPNRPAIITTGQSNSYGAGGNANSNVMISPFGDILGGTSSDWFYGGTTNLGFRTNSQEIINYSGWAAMADQISSMSTNAGWGTTNDCVWEAFGQNGINIGVYQGPPFAPFTASTNWAYAQNAVEQSLYGYNLSFPAIVIVGGESDNGNTGYGLNLNQCRQQYNNALRSLALIGPTNGTRIFFFQHSAFAYGWGCPENLNMLDTNNASKGLDVLVGPRYQYSYNPPPNQIHQDNAGYMRMGEQAGYAIFRTLTNGYWEPLRPLSVVLTSSNQISCTFTGLYSRLVLDTNSFWWLTNKANYGFAYSDSAGSAITSVALQSTNQVLLTLNSDVSGHTARTVNYAINSTTNIVACGTQWGPAGNLRDDCPVLGFRSTSNLWNWSVIFQQAVTTNTPAPPPSTNRTITATLGRVGTLRMSP